MHSKALGWAVSLAAEFAREQGNGHGSAGVTFVVGNPEQVLALSRPFRLDPLRGHPAHRKRLDDPDARATLKQLARLGETFIVSDEGVALSVVRLPSEFSERLGCYPMSWDARQVAAASVSALVAGAVAVVASADPAVRVFKSGTLVREISPPPEADRYCGNVVPADRPTSRLLRGIAKH